jgi:histidine ammonia-lyase
MPAPHRLLIVAVIALSGLAGGRAIAAAPPAYAPIVAKPQAEARTVVLTGHDLSLEDLIDVARDGAKLRFSPEAVAQAEAGRGLLAQGDAEGIVIYGVNRGPGALREQKVDRGPLTALAGARGGARHGALPEIDEEALVRAFLVIQANHMPYNAATAEYMTAVCELLNRRVTPVMYSRGTIGEGDLFLTSNYNATLVGRGEAYFKGQRMPAAEALAKAGMKPLAGPTGGGTTNAYATALAALLVVEGRDALDWADLTLGMDLLAMNSSITPLTPPVQAPRPFAWVNWEAAKLLEMVRGSYLTEDDPSRILQDPESLRASHIRQGSAWQAWAALRDAVTLQMNSGEQNPAVILDVKPASAWVLSTPWLMKYHVKGGPLSGGRSGYILSNANWDPYPMANEVEAFNLALANVGVVVAQRVERFNDRGPTAFFTGVKPQDVLTPDQIAGSPSLSEPFFTFLDVWKEMQMLTQSVPPDASGADFGVADLEAVSRLKAARGRQAVDLFMQLLSYDLITSTYWLDVRKAQNGARNFGQGPTAAWTALRKVLPWQTPLDERPDLPYGVIAYRFMQDNPARSFFAAAPPQPAGPPLARAQ